MNQAMREGYILTAAFADLLPAYEKQPDAMRLYYPDLIAAIDVKKEDKRLRTVGFAQSLPQRVIAPPAKMQIDPVEEALQTADGLMEQRDLESARKVYKKILEQTADKPKQGRALYGLGLIDLQEKHWDEALNLFQRTVDANPNPSTTAWSHYYLGQLALKAGNTERRPPSSNLQSQRRAVQREHEKPLKPPCVAVQEKSNNDIHLPSTGSHGSGNHSGLMYGQAAKAPQPKSQKERDALDEGANRSSSQ